MTQSDPAMSRTRAFLVIVMTIFTGITISGCDTANHAPSKPIITASDTQVESQSKVILNATSADPDGDIISWLWHADGGVFDKINSSKVTWTAPAVTDTQFLTISAQVRDPEGAESSAYISITVQPDQGGEPVEIILGSNDSTYYAPFWGDGNDFSRCQFLYEGSQIGHSGRITRIDFMSPVDGTGSYYQNFTVSLVKTQATELENSFQANYQGNTPELVYTNASMIYPESADQWFGIDLFSSFNYDTSSNLLVEFSWKNDNGYSVPCYGYRTENPHGNTTPYEDASEGLAEDWALYLRLTILE